MKFEEERLVALIREEESLIVLKEQEILFWEK